MVVVVELVVMVTATDHENDCVNDRDAPVFRKQHISTLAFFLFVCFCLVCLFSWRGVGVGKRGGGGGRSTMRLW